MATGVQTGQFVDRALETFLAVLEYRLRSYGVGPAMREQVAKDLLLCLEHDLAKGNCTALANWRWGGSLETAAGKPGTPVLYAPSGPVTPAAQPAAAVAAGVPRGTCPKCKKIYEKCSCSFGLPNGK